MQPLVLGRGFIGSSFISCALLRSRGVNNVAILSSTGRIFARRYQKGAAASSWDDAAEIYFSKPENAPKDPDPSSNSTPKSRSSSVALAEDSGSQFEEKVSKRIASDRKEIFPKSSRASIEHSDSQSKRSRSEVPGRNSASRSSQGEPRWRKYADEQMEKEKAEDDGSEEENAAEKTVRAKKEVGQGEELPVGMQRLKRGYGRNVAGFPVLKREGYERRRGPEAGGGYERRRGGDAGLQGGGYERRRDGETDFPVSHRGGYERGEEEVERPSEVPKLRGEVVYGFGPVKAAIQARRRDLHVLYVQERLEESSPGKKKTSSEAKEILRRANELKLKTVVTSKHVLNMLADNRPHQGLLLDASPLELVEVTSLDNALGLGDKVPVWIALDEVQDPQNLGAILRSAYFFGASGVVVCAKNSAPLSAVVSKASAGAMEVMELLSCRNMVKFLHNSIINGWRAVGSTLDADCVSVHEFPKDVPTILVLGNEGVGIRTNVMRTCSHMVRIAGALKPQKPKKIAATADEPEEAEASDFKTEASKLIEEDLECEDVLQMQANAVDSLNVSVATGILLHEFNEPEEAEASDFKTEASKLIEEDLECEDVLQMQANAVDSLNVSVATGILLHEFMNRK